MKLKRAAGIDMTQHVIKLWNPFSRQVIGAKNSRMFRKGLDIYMGIIFSVIIHLKGSLNLKHQGLSQSLF